MRTQRGAQKPEGLTVSNAIRGDEALTDLTEHVCSPCRDQGQKSIPAGQLGA